MAAVSWRRHRRTSSSITPRRSGPRISSQRSCITDVRDHAVKPFRRSNEEERVEGNRGGGGVELPGRRVRELIEEDELVARHDGRGGAYGLPGGIGDGRDSEEGQVG